MESNILIISLEIFSQATVQTVMMAYKELATISVVQVSDRALALKFELCKYGCQKTMCEFMNYLINLESIKV